jgi:1-acyl-sn-glycerol-3-phosphate acyltransferase
MIQVTSFIRWVVGFTLGTFILLFITLAAVIFPVSVYNKPACALLRVLVRVMGGRVTVEGAEHIDRSQVYLFMANHVSLFDVPILGGYIPIYARGLEAAEQFNYPVLGWFLRAVGNIPIARKNPRASWASMQHAVEELKKGKSIIILPEGTRTLTGHLSPFKKMPFQFAKMAGVPIIPIGLSGLYSFKRRSSWLLHPGPIKVKFGAPVTTADIERHTAESLQHTVRESIQSLIEFT